MGCQKRRWFYSSAAFASIMRLNCTDFFKIGKVVRMTAKIDLLALHVFHLNFQVEIPRQRLVFLR